MPGEYRQAGIVINKFYLLFIMYEYHYVTTKHCPLPVVYKEND